jgi:predicted DCC family thiol-disulfide oxidoreductase YuxK
MLRKPADEGPIHLPASSRRRSCSARCSSQITISVVASDSPNPIVFYDGVCGLCDCLVQFVVKRDTRDRFRFAALQSDFARSLLQKHGLALPSLETVCLLLERGRPTERIETRSTAVIDVLRELGPLWRTLANLFALLPLRLRDGGYNMVARSRYRLFGKYDTCPLPDPATRHKFLDMA